MDDETYWFQNPNSGWPMFLHMTEEGPAVDLEELEGSEAPDTDGADAVMFSRAVARCKSTYDAAIVLRADFGAADILD